MPFTQVRAARLTSQMAKHVNAARKFSTGAVLRKEIQDAYILSAARTPTAKASFCRIPNLIECINCSNTLTGA